MNPDQATEFLPRHISQFAAIYNYTAWAIVGVLPLGTTR